MYNESGDSYFPRSSTPEPVSGVSGTAKIKVIGVGGAGNNAVNRMLEAGITGAEYYVVNTDSQVLAISPCKNKIQIGLKLTKGLGAGADPEIGKKAAEENIEDLTKAVENTDLLFITAGMGGGTGTGAAPVIAKIAREKKILTVAVVTEPFEFEGKKRYENTLKGLDNLKKYVDTLVIIPNDKIKTVIAKGTTFKEAFRVADEILKQGIKGITELIVNPALINLDFADVRTILKDKGIAHLGVGVAKGDNRIVEAVRVAVSSPLLQTTIEGARGVILNVCGGPDLTFEEVTDAATLVGGVVDASANIIFGARIDPNVHDEVEVTVIATGFPGYDKPDQRAYTGDGSYPTRQNYGQPVQNGRMSVAEPAYPPRQPNSGYTQPAYPAQPPQTPYQQPVYPPQQPQQRTVYQNTQYTSQQGVPYQQPQAAPQQPQQGQYPVQPAQQQNAPKQEGVIERQSDKKIPKFIQMLRNNKKNDD